MRLNYFGYHLENIRTSKKYLFDMRNFIRIFCSIDNVEFKNSFTYGDEHLYLFPASRDIYLFVMTRSKEVIKKINTNTLSVNEIYDLLEQGEQLGFTSYVYFQQNFIGFASTMFAPKITAFTNLIDTIFEKLGIENYKFITEVFIHQATKEEILRLPFIGRTTIKIDKENNFATDILNTMGVTIEDTSELNSFEIVITPKSRKNIKPIVKKFITNIESQGLEKFIVKAKDELQDNLIDLYLVGKGAISELINTRDEHAIYEHIINKTENNPVLSQKIEEFTSNETFSETIPHDILRHNDANAWPTPIHSL